MDKEGLQKLKGLLLGLSLGQLKEIRNTCNSILNNMGEASTGSSTSRSAENLFTVMRVHLENRIGGDDLPRKFAFLPKPKQLLVKQMAEKLDSVFEDICKKEKQKALQNSRIKFYTLFVECTSDYLYHETRIPISLTPIGNQKGNIYGMIDHGFPGLAKSGKLIRTLASLYK